MNNKQALLFISVAFFLIGCNQETAHNDFHDYLYLRDNPAGSHQELWFHEQGDRSWLVVTRDTASHEITHVELAVDYAKRRGRDR